MNYDILKEDGLRLNFAFTDMEYQNEEFRAYVRMYLKSVFECDLGMDEVETQDPARVDFSFSRSTVRSSARAYLDMLSLGWTPPDDNQKWMAAPLVCGICSPDGSALGGSDALFTFTDGSDDAYRFCRCLSEDWSFKEADRRLRLYASAGKTRFDLNRAGYGMGAAFLDDYFFDDLGELMVATVEVKDSGGFEVADDWRTYYGDDEAASGESEPGLREHLLSSKWGWRADRQSNGSWLFQLYPDALLGGEKAVCLAIRYADGFDPDEWFRRRAENGVLVGGEDYDWDEGNK